MSALCVGMEATVRKTAAGIILLVSLVASVVSISPASGSEFIFPAAYPALRDVIGHSGSGFISHGDQVDQFISPFGRTPITPIIEAGELATTGSRLFVIATGSDEIVEISAASSTIVQRWSLLAGVGSRLAISGDDAYYAYGGDKVAVLDLTSGVSTDLGISTDSADPLLVVDGATLYVGERAANGTISRWDVSTLPAAFGVETAPIAAGDELRDLAVHSGDARLYVARKLATAFEVLDGITLGLVQSLPVAAPPISVLVDETSDRIIGVIDAPGEGNSVLIWEESASTHIADLSSGTPLGVHIGGALPVQALYADEFVGWSAGFNVDSISPSSVLTDEGAQAVLVDGDYMDGVTKVEVDGVDVPFIQTPSALLFQLPDQAEAGTVRVEFFRSSSSSTTNFISVERNPATAEPGVPGQVQVEPDDTSAVISWNEPGNIGPPILGYTAVAIPGGQSCETTLTSCEITGLTIGETYQFVVTATNAAGDSPPGRSDFVTLRPPPESPSGLSLNDDGVLSIEGGIGHSFLVQYREIETSARWLREAAAASSNGLAPAIVGGSTRAIDRHRYGVKTVMFVDDQVIGECGGVVIALDWVLTAAHCATYFDGSFIRPVHDIAVIYGVADLGGSGVSPDRNAGFSKSIIVHPDYDDRLLLNDLALIRLTSEMSPGLVDPIALYEGSGPVDGDPAFVSGWGATATGGFTVDHLRGVEVEIDADCGDWPVDEPSWDEDAYVCAGGAPSGFCQGDSGGPLVVNREGLISLAGLVSFNTVAGCGVSASRPDVYARVSNYLEWIEWQTGGLWDSVGVYVGGDQQVELPGLEPGRSYAVQVRARDGADQSDPILEIFSLAGAVILGPSDTGVDCTVTQPHPLIDVPASSFASNSVGCIYNLGITTGTSPTAYSPNNVVTREQMAAFIARFYKQVTGRPCSGSHPFVDVPRTSFASDAIGCIYGLDITTGTSALRYSPSDEVTREQMAAFIGRLYRLISDEACGSMPPFNDVFSTSFAFTDIGCIHGLGVTTGTSASRYSPNDVVTREQMAAFLARLYISLTS